MTPWQADIAWAPFHICQRCSAEVPSNQLVLSRGDGWNCVPCTTAVVRAELVAELRAA